MPDDVRNDLREALKLVAVALKDSVVPFALAGSYALWVRGGPEPEHDVDFMVAEEDAPFVMAHLAEQGLQVVQPPEDWLFKVFVGDVMVDVLFRSSGVPTERAWFDDVDEMAVSSVRMPVLSATTYMSDKLRAFDAHYCDFGAVLPAARAVREQVDWKLVAERIADNPYAEAFLWLLCRLEIAPEYVSPA